MKAFIRDFFRPELLFVYLVFIILELLTFRTGLGTEEFRTPWAVRQMQEGFYPLRDFIWEYGFLGPWLSRAVTILFGPELVAMRLVDVALGIPCIGLTFGLARRIAPVWLSAMIALIATGILTFPIYSYEHVWSVVTLLAAAAAAAGCLDTGKKEPLLWSSVLTVLTLLIRPLPTGAALTGAVFLTLCLAALQRKARQKISDVFLFAGSTAGGVIIAIAVYTLIFHIPPIRWTTLNLISPQVMGMGHVRIVTHKFPNSIQEISKFSQDYREHLHGNRILLLIRLTTLLNLLAGHLTYWIVFLLPIAYLIFAAYRRLANRVPFHEVKLFLALLSVGLGLYYHTGVTFHQYPDPMNFGRDWASGFFILHPGFILGFTLVFQILQKIKLPVVASGFCIALIGLSLIILPKLLNFRYFFIPMRTADVSPLKGIYLPEYYAGAFLPAIAFLEENENTLPKTIFSLKPEFEALAPQRPAFPEFYYIGYLPENFSIKPELFPHVNNREPVNIDEFMRSRLQNEKPIIILDKPLPSGPLEWQRYAYHHYALNRRFQTLNRIGASSVVDIYLPKEQP